MSVGSFDSKPIWRNNQHGHICRRFQGLKSCSPFKWRRLSGISRYIPVYIALLALSGLQVFLAYARLDRNRLLASMLAVAILSAALAIMHFMHMAQERRSFFWSLISATIFVLLMMNMIWSDSFRLLHMRPF
jgi:cytochrome c oxidase subunit IV